MKASDSKHKEMKADMWIGKLFEAFSRLNQDGLKGFHGMIPPTVGPVQFKNRTKIFRRQQEKEVTILGDIIAIFCKEKKQQD